MKDMEKFKNWLSKRAVVLLSPTNQWEVVRFKTVNGVSVVYTNKHNRLTFTGESQKAYDLFKAKKAWRITDKRRAALRAKKARLAGRDGKRCFFCVAKLNFDELTVEHLLSVAQGGSDNEANLCLACEPCNTALGSLPVVKKILFRDKRLKQAAVEIAKNDFYYYAKTFLGVTLNPFQEKMVEAILAGKTIKASRNAGYATAASVAFEVAKRRQAKNV